MKMIMNSYKEIKRKLIEFINNNDSYTQRSDKWYDMTKTTFGGSEIAALKGKNTYCSRQAVIERKINYNLGIDQYATNVACQWGIMFEPVIRDYIGQLYGDRVLGDNICIVGDTYRSSPDGYIILKTVNDKILTNDELNACEVGEVVYKIALLEFKCPLTRTPANKIPQCYVDQIHFGLANAPIANLAIYVDAVFRKCALDDLNDDLSYDTTYHTSKFKPKELVAKGMILIYDECTSDNVNADVVDYGLVDANQFNSLLIDIDKYLLQHIIFPTPKPQLIHKKLVGVIPWKLFKLVQVIESPLPSYDNYLQQTLDIIDSAIMAVNDELKNCKPLV